MENLFFFFFSSIFFIFIVTPSLAQSPSPLSAPPLPSPPPPPPPSPAFPPPPPPQQLRNIIDALIGAGDFTSWIAILSLANPLMIPMSTTFFIPQDTKPSSLINPTVSTMNNPLLFPYHIVPQRLTFSDLLLFKPHTRLPTLLPNMSLLITNSSEANFTINNVPVTHPNLYTTQSVSVHGISCVLDYNVFGAPFPTSPPPPPPPPATASPAPETTATTTETSNAGNNQVPEGILTPPSGGILTPIGDPSDAACSCTEVPIVFLIFCGVLAFKMQKIPFVR